MKNKRLLLLCRLALLSAAAIALSTLEGIFTPLLPPGAKAGLANVCVMLAADTLGFFSALAITLFKSAFALLTRGAVSAFLSLAGGLASTVVLWLLFRFSRTLSDFGISLMGAVVHSTAQLLGSYLLYGRAIFAYAPLLLLLSLPSGFITATLLRALRRLRRRSQHTKGNNDEDSL